jgi:hypothetical protein
MERYPEIINRSRTATKAFEMRIEAEKALEAFAEPGITEDEGQRFRAQAAR